MALAPTLGWLFVGRVINGITSASFSTANAYVADVTPPQERAKAFGLLGAAFGVGFIVGPAIGGVLGDINLRLPFWVSAGLAAHQLVVWILRAARIIATGAARARAQLAQSQPGGVLELPA